MELYDDKYVSLLPDKMALRTVLLNECIRKTAPPQGIICWQNWVWWLGEAENGGNFENCPFKTSEQILNVVYYNNTDENIVPNGCILQCTGCEWCDV